MATQGQTVEQLFGAALDQRPEDRRAFLDRSCSGAPELRGRVEELLLRDGHAGDALQTPLPDCPTTLADITGKPFQTSRTGLNAETYGGGRGGRFEPGQVIADRFAVVRFIAQGGMGEVYEVEDRFLQGVHIALKVIRPEIADDPGSSHRFEQEVLLARKVTHANLCPIYDISRCAEPAPPFLFLTMKLLAGETLAARLKRGALFSRDETISIFRQMVAGLAAIHAAGVIHRDIKPNNVMLDYSSSHDICLSIMDFGLARLHASENITLTSAVAGTPGYIAPELLRGALPSQASDLYALGVVLKQILTAEDAKQDGPPSARDAVAVPAALARAVKEFLSEDPARRSLAFKQIQSAFDAGGSIAIGTSSGFFSETRSPVSTRRAFVVGTLLTASAAAAGVDWKWDSVNRRLNNFFLPLPQKRFVALLNWPPTSDSRVKPMLTAVIEAIGNELARAEAFDRNLFIISRDLGPATKTIGQLNEVRERSGANLILAASGEPSSHGLRLMLRVLDPMSSRSIREKEISLPTEQQISFPAKAVRAAAELLNVNASEYDDRRSTPDTQSAAAYAAFEEAETLKKQENDTGLDAAIERYKQAVDLDTRYATAYARLALAYFRLYVLHGDPAALSLAHGNCDRALTLNPNSVEGHLALSSVSEYTGDKDRASSEIAKALSIDPINPRTLMYQGQLYSRFNRWPEAEETFKRVLRLRPNNWLIHNELGIVFNLQGQYSQSLEEFRAASLAAPKNALALNNVGDVYLREGKIADAEDAAARSLALHANDLASITMAAALRSEGKYADAIRFAEKAVGLNPSQSAGWLELGDCYSLLRSRRSDAEKAYARGAQSQEEGLRIDRTNGPGWMLLALLRAKSGAAETVLALIKKAEQSPANDIDSQLSKARTLEIVGRRDDALATVAACLRRGVTQFQIGSMLDLEMLRHDPRYLVLAKSTGPMTPTNL